MSRLLKQDIWRFVKCFRHRDQTLTIVVQTGVMKNNFKDLTDKELLHVLKILPPLKRCSYHKKIIVIDHFCFLIIIHLISTAKKWILKITYNMDNNIKWMSQLPTVTTSTVVCFEFITIRHSNNLSNLCFL